MRFTFAVAAVVGMAALVGCAVHDGPAPLFSADPMSPDNPLPDERTGDVLRPDWAFPFLPLPAWTLASEETFAAWGEALAGQGWGTTAPVFVRFAAPLSEKQADKLTAGAALFVQLDGELAPQAAVTTWIADPGTLIARPPTPLPESSRLALVVLRSLVPGQSLARSEAFEAFARGEGKADLERAAAAAGVAVDDIALLVAYRTGAPADGLVRARAGALAAGAPSVAFGSALPVDQLSGDLAAQATRLPPGARVAEGSFASLDLRVPGDEDDAGVGLWDQAYQDDVGAAPRATLLLVLVLPDPARFPPPWPTVIAQHGFNDDRTFGAKVGRAFVEQGRAVLAMDAASHGERGSAAGLIRLDSPRVFRDHMRQSALDLVQLISVVQGGDIDVDGVAGRDLDGTVSYFGHSMGTIIGGLLLGIEDRIDAAVMNAPGASYQDLFQQGRLRGSVSFLLKPALGLRVDDPAYDDALPFCAGAVESILEAADPLAYAHRHAQVAPPVLLQVNLGDGLLANGASYAWGDALHVQVAAAPVDDGAAHDALWTLDPAAFGYPEDDDPHGMHTFAGAPGIHDQAAAFLSSTGRRLVDPLAAP
ncbi:MAG: alpha/beta hydrolase [Deltaproteobacteria bacterium]|nr:alpha/beta hydrolase [Deltaproteobacteria bacterium]